MIYGNSDYRDNKTWWVRVRTREVNQERGERDREREVSATSRGLNENHGHVYKLIENSYILHL